MSPPRKAGAGSRINSKHVNLSIEKPECPHSKKNTENILNFRFLNVHGVIQICSIKKFATKLKKEIVVYLKCVNRSFEIVLLTRRLSKPLVIAYIIHTTKSERTGISGSGNLPPCKNPKNVKYIENTNPTREPNKNNNILLRYIVDFNMEYVSQSPGLFHNPHIILYLCRFKPICHYKD